MLGKMSCLGRQEKRYDLCYKGNSLTPAGRDDSRSKILKMPMAKKSQKPNSQQLWTDCVWPRRARRNPPFLIGVLKGEGIGPEVVDCALQVLSALEASKGQRFQIEFGGAIGKAAQAAHGKPLTAEVIKFCTSIFDRRGAVLAGAGGGRFVYDLRKQFDLYCKFSPLAACPELAAVPHIKPEHIQGVDILVVRENVGGIYQGKWKEETTDEGRRAWQTCSYTEQDVRRILQVAVGVARQRRGKLAVVCKDAGLPTISGLWREVATELAGGAGVECSFLDVDHAAYFLIQHPQKLDVVAASNLFGDVLADLGAVLLGSRGITFSGNFAPGGAAVYQTNHGAAHDLAGSDRANPVGQIYSLAMLLRESFNLVAEARLIEEAVRSVWHAGWRTFDLEEPGTRVIGTREMGQRIADRVARQRAEIPA